MNFLTRFLPKNTTNNQDSKTLLTNTDNNSTLVKDYLLKTLNSMHDIEGREFEEFMNELFLASGYETNLTPEKCDGGVDLFVTKDNITTAIQLKKRQIESTQVISVDEVRKLAGIITTQNTELRGSIITTHYFSKEAHREAKLAEIELIDKEGLLKLIANLQPALIAAAYYETVITPLGRCPKCNNVNIYRYNQKTKQKYCRCINYPECKG